MQREIVSMKISFCTTVFKRLFQLKQTLPHNVKFTKVGEVEINILAYNAPSIRIYLEKKELEIMAKQLSTLQKQAKLEFAELQNSLMITNEIGKGR